VVIHGIAEDLYGNSRGIRGSLHANTWNSSGFYMVIVGDVIPYCQQKKNLYIHTRDLFISMRPIRIMAAFEFSPSPSPSTNPAPRATTCV
jgi:hypothetical protein